jgi:hypothetical protein
MVNSLSVPGARSKPCSQPVVEAVKDSRCTVCEVKLAEKMALRSRLDKYFFLVQYFHLSPAHLLGGRGVQEASIFQFERMGR